MAVVSDERNESGIFDSNHNSAASNGSGQETTNNEVEETLFDGFQGFVGVVPLCLYLASSYLFFPIFQEMIYQKACLEQYYHLEEVSSVDSICSNSSAIHKDHLLQEKANRVLLLTTVCLTVPSVFVATVLGSLSDRLSRKLAMLVPFCFAVLADLTFIIQACYMNLSSYWLLVSQLVFGLGGGYAAIFGTIFAHAAQSCKTQSQRSRRMGLLEGSMALGGTAGYYSIGPLLNALNFKGVFVLIAAVHTFCFFFLYLLVKEARPVPVKRPSILFAESEISWYEKVIDDVKEALLTTVKPRTGQRRVILLVLLGGFGISFFVYSGSQDIIYFYLKLCLNFSPRFYGYLKGSIYAAGAVMTLLLYPALKYAKVKDTVLAEIGLVSRLLGRVILTTVFSTGYVFSLIGFDMFSRFGAAALRSLISHQVAQNEQGKIFSVVALLEAVCSLVASAVFNAVYPSTLHFFPAFCFVLLAALMLIPVLCVAYVHVLLNRPEIAMQIPTEDEDEANIVH